MARSIKACLNREVLSLKEGLRIGKPHDILVDPRRHRVAALVMAIQSSPQTATAISGRAVNSFAEDTLPIGDVTKVVLGYQDQELLKVLEENLQFRRRDIISTAGHNMGRIVDVMVDDDGKVTEYRVAKGTLQRLLRLHKTIMPGEMKTAGEDVAVAREPEQESTQE